MKSASLIPNAPLWAREIAQWGVCLPCTQSNPIQYNPWDYICIPLVILTNLIYLPTCGTGMMPIFGFWGYWQHLTLLSQAPCSEDQVICRGAHLSLQRLHPLLEGLGLGLSITQAQSAALQLPLQGAPLQLQFDGAAL